MIHCSVLCVEFAGACEQSTDFHFASVEHQFEMIGDCLVSARDGRLRRKPTAAAADAEADKMSAQSSASSTSDDVCLLLSCSDATKVF